MKSTIRSFLKPLSGQLRKLPSFLIIGVRKGGTTSLFQYLGQHPQILVPVEKELHYFSLYYERGMAWYRQRFPLIWKAGITGEATPAYFFHPAAASRIKRSLPNVKLILQLRDPVERAFSNFQMHRRLGWEELETFEEAISRELAFLEDEIESRTQNPPVYSHRYHHQAYLHQGLYGHHLREWLAYFPLSQLLIIDSADFFSSPEASLKRCYEFLSIDQQLPADLEARNVGKYQERISDELRVKLRQFYSQDAALLQQLTGKVFSWMS